MTRGDFESGKIYIYYGGFTHNCFRVVHGKLEAHMIRRETKPSRSKEYLQWKRAYAWSINNFYKSNGALREINIYYISPDDYFLQCMCNVEL